MQNKYYEAADLGGSGGGMSEKRKIENLMKPRFKVIADYPDSSYEIGEIIEEDDPWWQEFYKPWPHLFKPLSWWEERKEEDMPEYVKIVDRNGRVEIKPFKDSSIHEGFINLPSTKEEFDAYNAAQSKKDKP